MPDAALEERPIATADRHASRITVFRAAAGKSPVVIVMPAMGVPARFYEPFARALAASGIHTVTADLRGIGHSSLRASRRINFGYHEMLEHDWPAVVDEVRAAFPEGAVYLLGHSLGGQISACWVAANPGKVEGLILVGCCSVFYKGWDFPTSLSLLALTQLTRVVTRVVGYFPGKSVGFGGTEARRVMRDWAHTARTGRYDVAKSPLDYESLLPQAQLPVLALSLEGDHYAPRRAVDNLCHKLSGCTVTHLHLSTQETGLTGMKHFTWAKAPDAVVRHIQDWLAKATG
jgi:predicted alpha/beta hydrolase